MDSQNLAISKLWQQQTKIFKEGSKEGVRSFVQFKTELIFLILHQLVWL